MTSNSDEQYIRKEMETILNNPLSPKRDLASAMRLITAYANKARLDELTRVLQRPYIAQNIYGQERIAELKGANNNDRPL